MLCLFPHINFAEEKHMETMDGSKVLSFNKLKAELLYPSRVENQDNSPHVINIAVDFANILLAELRDPKKATSNYLRSAERKLS